MRARRTRPLPSLHPRRLIHLRRAGHRTSFRYRRHPPRRVGHYPASAGQFTADELTRSRPHAQSRPTEGHPPTADLRTYAHPSATHLLHRRPDCRRPRCPKHRVLRPTCRVMGLHKLTAGDGYSYLTRQVAAHDSTEKGHTGLGDYYSQKGESPGRWLGSGLAGLDSVNVGDEVTAEQMKALFGEGRHPNAEAIEHATLAAGLGAREALRASKLGRAVPIFEGESSFRIEVARRFTAYNIDRDRKWNAPIPAAERARIRTQVGREMFTAEFGRDPAEARELSGFIARASRQATTAVAGYDLTF